MNITDIISKIEETNDELFKIEKELLNFEIKHVDLEAEIKNDTNKLMNKTKEEWGELGITNSEGRKGYVASQLEENKKVLLNCKKQIMIFKTERTRLNRILNINIIYLENILKSEVSNMINHTPSSNNSYLDDLNTNVLTLDDFKTNTDFNNIN